MSSGIPKPYEHPDPVDNKRQASQSRMTFRHRRAITKINDTTQKAFLESDKDWYLFLELYSQHRHKYWSFRM